MDKSYYENCRLCPRGCGANRFLSDGKGFCQMPAALMAARAGLHFYEEPFLSGEKGSGTVFFSGCSLKCTYCQNYQISTENIGFEISIQRLAEVFLEQQERGAHNINIVTGTHYTPSIAAALEISKKDLHIPVIWNSSAYELPETLSLLDGLVDIWLPDFKTLNPELSKRYFKSGDYPERAKAALDFMVNSYLGSRQPGESLDIGDGEHCLMEKGVVVRHLVIPGQGEDSKAILKYLYEKYGDNVWISIMKQYTPLRQFPYAELNRTVSDEEYDDIVDYAIDLGIENAMIQEDGAVGDSFIPIFDGAGII